MNSNVAIKTETVGSSLAGGSPHYKGYEKWKGWDRPFTFTKEEADYFKGEMRGIPIAGKNILEIGFGQGSFLAWAKLQAADIAGTEINSIMLQAAWKNGVDVLNADLVEAAVHNRGRFDVIVAFDVFEHLTHEEVASALNAVHQMLCPRGYLVLRFPNGQSPFGLYPQYGDITHRTPLSKDIVEQLCRNTGLVVIRYRGAHRIRGPIGLKMVARMLRGVARDLLGTILNAVFACNIPWDAVVVLVLRKAGDKPEGSPPLEPSADAKDSSE